MWIELDTDQILPATTITGTLHDAPPDGAEVTIAALTTNSFHERAHEVGTTHLRSGRFELAAPRWPLTANGPFLRVRWWVEATSPDGADYTRTDFDLVRDGVEIECLTNDDLDAPLRGRQWSVLIIGSIVAMLGIAGLVTAFGTGSTALRVISGVAGGLALLIVIAWFEKARHHTLLGHVRCRVDADQHGLGCTVAIHPPGGHPPEGLEVTAEFVVVESAKRRRLDLSDEAREEILIKRPITLARGRDLRWHGVIDIRDVVNELPLSRSGSDGPISWTVTWAVKIVIDAPRMRKRVKPMWLVAHPTGLPRDVGAKHHDVPSAAR